MNRQFIAASKEYNSRQRHIGAPIFRKEFAHGFDGKPCKLQIGTTGFYRLFLNGKELSKGYMAPYIANPDHFVYYDEFDVTDVLQKSNVLCVLLGNGFGNALDCDIWEFESAPYRTAPKMHLALFDGETRVWESDENFEVFASPITFDDIRFGEYFDARLVRPELLQTGKCAGGRKALCVAAPRGEWKKCDVQPLRFYEEIAPKSVKATDGGYLYDFGQNNSGVFRLSVVGKAGQIIKMTFGEMLRNGKLYMDNITFADRGIQYDIQHDEYTCTDGKQTYVPSFTYHGYQYVFVEGIEEKQATLDLLTMIVMHSSVPAVGRFACSNATVNKIEEATRRSDLANFCYFPTDCPHREKNGWTGDAAFSAEQFLYHFDCGKSLREWLGALRKTQRENGQLPGIAPTSTWGYDWGNGPAWDYAIAEIPYQVYRFTGDVKIIEENADAIERYFAYAQTKINEDGLLAYGLGDWCEAGSVNECSTPLEVTDTLVMIDASATATKILSVIGRTIAAEEIAAFGNRLKVSFRKKYVRGGEVICRTQTAQAKAIACGIFTERELPEAYACLQALLQEKNGRFKVGVVGAKVLFDSLTQANLTDMAFSAIVGPEFPSYGYWLLNGATTLWESFSRIDEHGMPEISDSRNHHFWGSVTAWFYRVLAGLQILSHSTARICPHIASALDWAEAEYAYNGKNLRVRWERRGENIAVQIANRGFTGEIAIPNYHTDKSAILPLESGEREYIFLQNAKM